MFLMFSQLKSNNLMSTIEKTDAMKLFDYGIQSMRAQSMRAQEENGL